MNRDLIFVADTDKETQKLIESVYSPGSIDVRHFTSAVEIFSLLEKTKPVFILLSLELPDLDDFVMHDLLKKTHVSASIPVFITYTEKSAEKLEKCRKLKYKAEGYLKKPISARQIKDQPGKYLSFAGNEENLDFVERVDEDEFSDENIDRLVRGELVDMETGNREKTNGMPKKEETMSETKKELLVELELDMDDDEPPAARTPGKVREDNRQASINKDLNVKLMSLESQNQFLRKEKQKLSLTLQALQIDFENEKAQNQQLQSQVTDLQRKEEILKKHVVQLEEEKSALQNDVKDAYQRLSDKETQWVTKNHEAEGNLRKRLDQAVRETEERLAAGFKEQEEQLENQIQRIKDDKKTLEAALNSRIEELTEENNHLQNQTETMKKREDSQNRTISTLAEEKVAVSEKITELQNAMSEKENAYKTDVDNLKEELKEKQEEIDSLQNRLEELGGLIRKSLSLTDVQRR
jgi:DNA-binding response OmpR family regulator/predicted  nucleic acid-binding Zn-ribbon protein